MTPIRLGAVGYLNARPLVVGLDRVPRFDLRFDLPSECARLLAASEIDLGLIPSVEYLRDESYRIVPDIAIASTGKVVSVALFTTRPIRDVRSIVMDTSSRTSVALTRVLCARLFDIAPTIESGPPDLKSMLSRADAALMIGDRALLVDRHRDPLREPAAIPNAHGGANRIGTVRLRADTSVRLKPDATQTLTDDDGNADNAAYARAAEDGDANDPQVEKIDLGEAWTSMTGLPFVWACWVGRSGALGVHDVDALRAARDAGVAQSDRVAREYFRNEPEHQELGVRYLRDNIKYDLGADERAGLELFYRYAAEIGVAPGRHAVRFY